MRCYGASLRCRRAPGGRGRENGGRKASWSGAALSPFASEEPTTRRAGEKDGEVDDNPGIRLDDLLSIADTDVPGAVLVDSKCQTCW